MMSVCDKYCCDGVLDGFQDVVRQVDSRVLLGICLKNKQCHMSLTLNGFSQIPMMNKNWNAYINKHQK